MKNKKAFIMISCIILSLVFNYFFVLSHFGISVLLFNVALLLIGYFCLKDTEDFSVKIYAGAAVCIILLSIPYMRFDYALFKVLNALLILAIYGWIITRQFSLNCFKWMLDSLTGLIGPIAKLHCIFVDFGKLTDKKGKYLGKLIIGLLLSAAMLTFVVPLLISSDSVFKTTVSSVLDGFDFGTVTETVIRMVIFIFMVAYLYAHLGNMVQTIDEDYKLKQEERFDLTISNVFLVTVNIVYVMFSFIQIKYLFIKNALPHGMNYSEYARQGFFQLVFVTILNLIVIVVFNQYKKHHLSVNILLLITVICTYIMTISAFYRMSMYESQYGYTRPRLLVYLFLIGELIALVPIIIGIFKQNFRFIEVTALVMLAYYIAISFINIDAFIAEKNITRYVESEKEWTLDHGYLVHVLSTDALSVIDENMDVFSPDMQEFYKDYIIKAYKNSYDAKWYEFNISNSKVEELAKKYRREN